MDPVKTVDHSRGQNVKPEELSQAAEGLVSKEPTAEASVLAMRQLPPLVAGTLNVGGNQELEAFRGGAQPELLVVMFTAVWCGPCRMLTPMIEELAREFAGQNDKKTVYFLSINIDAHENAGQAWDIHSIPTLLFFTAGGKTALRKFQGVQPKSRLTQAIEELA